MLIWQIEQSYIAYFSEGSYVSKEYDGIMISANKGLSQKDVELIEAVMRDVKKVIIKDEVKGLNLVTYTLREEDEKTKYILPRFEKLKVGSALDVSGEVRGRYVPHSKQVFVYVDNYKTDGVFNRKGALLFTTLHEIAHHYDIFILGNNLDDFAEQRANTFAIQKLTDLGYEFSPDELLFLTHKGDWYSRLY